MTKFILLHFIDQPRSGVVYNFGRFSLSVCLSLRVSVRR